MTPGHLSNWEQEFCRILLIKQISSAIDTLTHVRSELRGDYQYSDEEMLCLTLLLVYINKTFKPQ